MSCLTYLDSYYAATGSKQVAPEHGRVHERIVHHGTHVYLTKEENDKFNLAELGLMASIFSGLAVMGIWRKRFFAKQFNQISSKKAAK